MASLYKMQRKTMLAGNREHGICLAGKGWEPARS